MEHSLDQVKEFARHIAETRTPQNESSYKNSFGRNYSYLRKTSYTKAEIQSILNSGNTEQIRDLSKYFKRFSGIYARTIQYYSSLLNYQYILVPHYDIAKPPKKLISQYKKIAQYLKDLNLNFQLPQINEKVLEEGIYYGFLKENTKGHPVFYPLPSRYCRTRFNDENGLPILELNLNYFDLITYNQIEKKEILSLFPKQIVNRYRNRNKKDEIWASITPTEGGMVFFFDQNQIPPFISAIDSIADLEEARIREKTRDEHELQKILIQKFPMNEETGELAIPLEEASVFHNSLTNMLNENDTIDVLTTYADIELEDVQSATDATSASTNRLNKYLTETYNEFGTTSEIFNANSGNAALNYSIKKDISIMLVWSKQYETWINVLLKQKYKSDSFYFSITMLPTSQIFQQENLDTYLKAAQYGYPKSAVASAMGIDMLDLTNLSDFENNVLKLHEILIPLQSSFTQTSKGQEMLNLNSNSQEKNAKTDSTKNPIFSEGGRPEKSAAERSDKTDSNQNSET